MENLEACIPPGFRFRPTEEELVGYYLKRKVNSMKIDLDVIIEIDLYRIEPWDIQDMCKLGHEEQNEWYFFSHKDRKYPTGTRTNRATAAGFWKATGRDKAVVSKDKLIGMRKTLVFYKGRAPNGRKTDWIMHEYRLQTFEHEPHQEEGWVVCRAFKKPTPNHKQGFESWTNNMTYSGRSDYIRPPSLPGTTTSTTNLIINDINRLNRQPPSSFIENRMLEFPKLDSSPSISYATNDNNIFEDLDQQQQDHERRDLNNNQQYCEWKSFDKLLESQVIGTSSFVHPNMSHSDEFDAQTHMSGYVLECFPGF